MICCLTKLKDNLIKNYNLLLSFHFSRNLNDDRDMSSGTESEEMPHQTDVAVNNASDYLRPRYGTIDYSYQGSLKTHLLGMISIVYIYLVKTN